jgi:hypothetical protein
MSIADLSDPPASGPVQERTSYDGLHSTLAQIYRRRAGSPSAPAASRSTPKRSAITWSSSSAARR